MSKALAEELGFALVDRELAEETARRMGLQPEVVQGRDERAPAIVEELGLAMAAGTIPFGAAPPPELADQAVDDRTLAEATRRVIESLAGSGNCVILGRGAQAALADRPDACHISLVGDVADRTRRIAQWQGVDERAARRLCEQVDAERAGYLKRFYSRDIRDPLLYDCVLNTSGLGVEGALPIAVAVVRGKLGLTS